VALGDHIAARGGYGTLLVIIGERPGLSVADSLGIYLTHLPRPGRTDADRNCISNIHPPDGLGYHEAARVAATLVRGARELGRSGVALKDVSGGAAVETAHATNSCVGPYPVRVPLTESIRPLTEAVTEKPRPALDRQAGEARGE
jgi:hypothetical protein